MAQSAQFTTPVDAVVSRMRTLDAELPERDGLAVFNRVYLTVTEEFDRHLDTGVFPDRRAAITLDVRFAERYLAVAEEGRAPACWRPVLQFRRHPGYVRCSSRSRASTRTSGTIWRSPWWTPVVRSTANRLTWRTSSTAWAISSSRWRNTSAKI